jgi:hypothetical protein
MQAARTPMIWWSRRTQYRGVLVLTAALLMWIVAYATHEHASDDQASRTHSHVVCSFCFANPVGGAAPAEYRLPQVVRLFSAISVFSQENVLARIVPSSYLSRGPPAQ